ncbi:MAG: hypothetical protein ACE5G7_05310 [Candidatus Hydrothermarchaeaceae archaeon]
MNHELILAGESLLALLVSLGLLALSIWKKEELISEAAWDRLIERTRIVRLTFALSFISLIVYLFAESTELLSIKSPPVALESVHEIGEAVHMFITALAVLVAIPLFSAIMGGEDAT